MLEGERLICDGRRCFTHFYYITGIGPRSTIIVNDPSARGPTEAHVYILTGACTRTSFAWRRPVGTSTSM